MKKYLFLILGLFYFSCREVDISFYSPATSYDPNVRINPGYGIDAVLLGNTPEKVRQILGQESHNMFWDGFNDGGEGVGYTSGTHQDLSVYFSHDQNNTSIAFVQSLTVKGNYNGKTKDNLGLGSTFSDVGKIYGDPIKSINVNDSIREDYYCINSRVFSLTYNNNIINSITIRGYQKRNGDIINCQ
jgi:hypothetical protein